MNFIINTITGWEEPPRARHQLSDALHKLGHSIVFVAKNKKGLPRFEHVEPKKNFIVVTPFFPVDYRFRYRIPLLNELYQLWLYRHIKRAYPDYQVINFDFTAHLLFNFFKKIIYYCNDEYIGNSKYPIGIVNYYHKVVEAKLTRKAVFCVATSQFLMEKLEKLNPKVFYIPLGAPSNVTLSTNIVNNSIVNHNTNVGLVGFVTLRNISIDLINQILKEGLKVTIIGPVEDEFVKAVQYPEKLVLRGSLIGEDLFAAISDFDVAIAPYDLNKANKGTTPNKMWQYLAVGKPVVVSNLPNLKHMHIPEGLIYVAEKDTDFTRLIRTAVKEDNNAAREKRIQFAKENSWDHRAKEFIELVLKY